MGPDNAECLMLPVKSGIYYFKYLVSDRVQAYFILFFCHYCASQAHSVHPQCNTKFSILISHFSKLNILSYVLEYRNTIVSSVS